MGHAVKKDQRYRYEDCLRWPDEERWEIIDGAAYDMSDAPRVRHQDIVGNFYIRLKTHPNNPCYTGIAPTDVVFDEYNVVQPDVFMVCDRKNITPDNVRSAPDLIIEVASPGTEVKDRREKKRLYERFGVRHYLIVFPEREYLEYYRKNGDVFEGPVIFDWDETLTLSEWSIAIDLWDIFDKAPPADQASVQAPNHGGRS
jgi:Uma2 family endonuclease